MTLPVDWKSFNLCQNLSGPQIILKVATTGFVSLNLYFDKIDEYINQAVGLKNTVVKKSNYIFYYSFQRYRSLILKFFGIAQYLLKIKIFA